MDLGERIEPEELGYDPRVLDAERTDRLVRQFLVGLQKLYQETGIRIDPQLMGDYVGASSDREYLNLTVEWCSVHQKYMGLGCEEAHRVERLSEELRREVIQRDRVRLKLDEAGLDESLLP